MTPHDPPPPEAPLFGALTTRAGLLLLAFVAARAAQRAALFPPELAAAPWICAALLVALREQVAFLMRTGSPARRAAGELAAALVALLALQASVSARFTAVKGCDTVAAAWLVGQALPLAPFAGAQLLHASLRRRRPEWVAARLMRRVAGSTLAVTLVLAASARSVRGDPWLVAAVGALALVSWLGLRQSRRAGVLRSSSNPITSTTSSSRTDGP